MKPEDLTRDDRIVVDNHDKTLRVHDDSGLLGTAVCVAYDTTGAKWTIHRVDGDLYMGTLASRRKEINTVTKA